MAWNTNYRLPDARDTTEEDLELVTSVDSESESATERILVVLASLQVTVSKTFESPLTTKICDD